MVNTKKTIEGNQKKEILKKNTQPYIMTRVNEDFYGKSKRMEPSRLTEILLEFYINQSIQFRYRK